MKILLIHRYFWPDHPNCGQILWHLTQKLATQGHQVDVLTSLPSKDLNSKKIVSEKFQILTNIKIERMDLSIENNSPIKKIINALKLGFRTNFLVINNCNKAFIASSYSYKSRFFYKKLILIYGYSFNNTWLYICLFRYYWCFFTCITWPYY